MSLVQGVQADCCKGEKEMVRKKRNEKKAGSERKKVVVRKEEATNEI